jgi:hypothetical protein
MRIEGGRHFGEFGAVLSVPIVAACLRIKSQPRWRQPGVCTGINSLALVQRAAATSRRAAMLPVRREKQAPGVSGCNLAQESIGEGAISQRAETDRHGEDRHDKLAVDAPSLGASHAALLGCPWKGKRKHGDCGRVRELTNERHERKSQGEAKTWGGEGDRATRG